jgi:Family of unknown function (DUF6807)
MPTRTTLFRSVTLKVACTAVALSLSAWIGGVAQAADAALPDAKPVPVMQAVPLPYDQISIQRDGRELTRYHLAAGLRRPFLYPVIGPAGRSLTRMGHPHDPVSHSHHNSVWISHNDVNGIDFWGDHGKNAGTIVHERVVRDSFVDSDAAAGFQVVNRWVGPDGQVVMRERRRVQVQPLPGDQWLLVIDLQFEPPGPDKPVTFGQTAFGVIGVRMAKSIGVNDGGGLIRNSEGNVNEQGDNGCFRKPARWCDYSGRITNDAVEGITLMDHPSNPNHPAPFHVRGDGWMGACLTLDGPRKIEPGQTLRLRYGLWIHAGAPDAAAIDKRWRAFAATKVEPLTDATPR